MSLTACGIQFNGLGERGYRAAVVHFIEILLSQGQAVRSGDPAEIHRCIARQQRRQQQERKYNRPLFYLQRVHSSATPFPVPWISLD